MITLGKIGSIVGFIYGILLPFFPKAIFIDVECILPSAVKITEVNVHSCIGDSILVMVDSHTKDTIKKNCKEHKYHQDFLDSIGPDHIWYGMWSGTMPKVGEKVIYVEYIHNNRQMILFGRTEDNHYRFWNPYWYSMANTVFVIPVESTFNPTNRCNVTIVYNDEKNVWCDDGFIINTNDFETLIANLKK